MAQALTVELPESVTQLFGTPEQAAAKAKESLVMVLLRQEQIGQSLAAELLGVTRARVLELMDHCAIP